MASSTSSSSSCSSSISFFTKLEARVNEINSHLCVGLDPHIAELFPTQINDINSTTTTTPPTEEEKCDAAFTFCKTIIDATLPHAACYKPNGAFFEALGSNLGAATLRRVIASIPDNVPVLLDVKRGDIGSTASAYADACYESAEVGGLGADGVTLSPLMGWDSVKPFVTGKYSDRGAFILCKTSNPSSSDILTLNLKSEDMHLYEKIAKLSNQWSNDAKPNTTTAEDTSPPRIGLVVGATDPTALQRARLAAGEDVWILAPGIGFQGGNLEEACRAGFNSNGRNMLIPISRGISRADDLGAKAEEFKNLIEGARTQILEGVSTTSTLGGESLGGAGSVLDIEPYQQEFIEFALSEKVLKLGSFVLKSGRTSPYFFNAGLFDSGMALYKLGKAYAAAIMAAEELVSGNNVTFDIIFGPAYKGISLGAMVASSLYENHNINVGFAYNRKEAKSHGEGGTLVGANMVGKRVLIVDDVITAGTAIRESYSMLKEVGALPMGVSIALDRAEKRSLDDPLSAVQAVARDLEIPVVSIVDLPQLTVFLKTSGDFSDEVVESVMEYRAQYGV